MQVGNGTGNKEGGKIGAGRGSSRHGGLRWARGRHGRQRDGEAGGAHRSCKLRQGQPGELAHEVA